MFLGAGASVVVATVTALRGRYAAPTSTEVVRDLLEAAKRDGYDNVIGEVVRQLRCKQMRAGQPMALTLIAYGDADWRLATEDIPPA